MHTNPASNANQMVEERVFVWVLQEMARAWEEYSRLEQSVELLRLALQAYMTHNDTSQVGLPSAL